MKPTKNTPKRNSLFQTAAPHPMPKENQDLDFATLAGVFIIGLAAALGGTEPALIAAACLLAVKHCVIAPDREEKPAPHNHRK
jgi:hypothetical protein